MDTRLTNSRKKNVLLTLLVLCVCSALMMATYPSLYHWTDNALDPEEKKEGVLKEMGDDLAVGNYILYNEISNETSRSEILEDFSSSGVNLTLKYVDYGIFDEEGNSLLKDTPEDTVDSLWDEGTDRYAVRAAFSFNEVSELADVNVTGSELEPEEEYNLERTFIECAESASINTIGDISTPTNLTVVYGMTEQNLNEYQEMAYAGYDETVYLLLDYSDFQSFVAPIGIAVALAALLIPCIKGVGKWEGSVFRLPFEVVVFLLYMTVLPLFLVGNVVYLTLNGQFWNNILGGLPTMAFNFILWIIFFGYIYWLSSCLREIFVMKGAYWRERTLTAKALHWMRNRGGRYGRKMKSGAGGVFRRFKSFFAKQYDALMHLDFQDKTNRTILRVVLINFAILFVVCIFWFYGIFALIVYSVILFLFLRKYSDDLRDKYSLLLKSTNQLAEGHLDVPIEGDIGIFNPIQEELKRIQKGFKKAVDEEVKNERMKTELVTNVSHDLRTPLTAIITYIDLLKSEKDEKKRGEYIEILERKSLRLKVLIEDLFEISKAASKNVVMHYMKVDIVDLIKQAGLENDSKIKDASLEFRWKLPDHKVIMCLDSQKTYRIFENLIVNITKYAMPHTRVYIEMTEQEAGVHISMKNISAGELNFDVDEITDRFVRGDSSRNTEGSGLGLAIAKSFVELQHGSLKISTDADLFKAEIVLPNLEMPEEDAVQGQRPVV